MARFLPYEEIAMPTRRPSRCAHRSAGGFSFIEILVVMGIIATLAGLGLIIVTIMQRRGPQNATALTVNKTKALIDSWNQRFHEYPPMRLTLMARVAQLPVPKQATQNSENEPIEALYQALYAPGFGMEAELGESEVGNTDEDKLTQQLTTRGVDLREILDAWGNPLVYFVNTEYVAAERNPPSYFSTKESSVNPVPYKDPGGGFVNPKSFQIFSMGEDARPNTDDDVLGW